jgi:NADH dehydrogenase/NADH:ubiquinone oxidoreductase subunit G
MYCVQKDRFVTEQSQALQIRRSGSIVYEPGKCIRCGLCIAVCREAGEPIGLAFKGRGFDVEVGVPFEHSLTDAMLSSAARCAAVCPTGALFSGE